MHNEKRSNCPVFKVLDLIGDKWSLLILRDIILRDKRFFNEFIESDERIATNILSNRLAALESNGLINKVRDTKDRKRFIYSPTKKGLDLLPVIIAMVLWISKYDPEDSNVPELIKKDPAAFEKKVRAKFSF